MRIGLVGCTKSKLERQAAARDLYSPSPLFRGRRSYVEHTCENWFILSAKHHVLSPDELVEPYDMTLVGAPTEAKRVWARAVLKGLENLIGDVRDHHFEIHAGRDYWAFGLVEGLKERGAKISIPPQGLGLFDLSTFYAKGAPPRQNPNASDYGKQKRGSYQPLRTHLLQAKGERVSLSFNDVERVLGRPLPASAHNHRAWWANHASTHHARSWLEAGWKVSEVNLTSERVTFRKER